MGPPPLGEGREHGLEVEGEPAQSSCLTRCVVSRERMPTDVAAASAVRGPEGSGGGSAGGKEAEKRARRAAAAAGQAPAEVPWPRWESLHGLAVVIVAGSSAEGQ